eukprot:775039-Amorphochlora_amoeboformis.AAC.1
MSEETISSLQQDMGNTVDDMGNNFDDDYLEAAIDTLELVGLSLQERQYAKVYIWPAQTVTWMLLDGKVVNRQTVNEEEKKKLQDQRQALLDKPYPTSPSSIGI